MSTATVMPPPSTQPRRAHIRWMLIPRDVPEVLEIETATFQAEAWSAQEISAHPKRRDTIGMVVEIDDKVIGYFFYQLTADHLRIINLAVHPDYRRQGFGGQIMEKLQSKLAPGRRTKLVALLPKSLAHMRAFFKHHGVEILPTETKGLLSFKPVISVMSPNDTEEAQLIENTYMTGYGVPPRDIAAMITGGTGYGLIVRNQTDGELLGYALYCRDPSGIDINGEYGIVVKVEWRRRGIGRRLMQALADQDLPITISDINRLCKVQVAFLTAMGVPVPALQPLITVKWKPERQPT